MPDTNMMSREWASQFGQEDAAVYTSDFLLASAPGRVNLIGEHTDYSAGFVFPCGLARRVAFVLRARADSKVRVWAVDIQERGEADLATVRDVLERPVQSSVKTVTEN